MGRDRGVGSCVMQTVGVLRAVSDAAVCLSAVQHSGELEPEDRQEHKEEPEGDGERQSAPTEMRRQSAPCWHGPREIEIVGARSAFTDQAAGDEIGETGAKLGRQPVFAARVPWRSRIQRLHGRNRRSVVQRPD